MMNDRRDTTPITRRVAAGAIAMSGLGLVWSPRLGHAQEATPTALPHALNEWIAGWQALDADRIAAVYHEDAVHLLVALDQTLTGREAIRANIVALMEAVPDATLAVNQAFGVGDAAAVDWSYAGHYTNPFPGFPPPAGQALAFRASTLFQLADGLVTQSTEFFDFYGLAVQLGLLPPPGGEAQAEATPA
jgi:steroid delta-isomerase-like uncharacterized protein